MRRGFRTTVLSPRKWVEIFGAGKDDTNNTNTDENDTDGEFANG